MKHIIRGWCVRRPDNMVEIHNTFPNKIENITTAGARFSVYKSFDKALKTIELPEWFFTSVLNGHEPAAVKVTMELEG